VFQDLKLKLPFAADLRKPQSFGRLIEWVLNGLSHSQLQVSEKIRAGLNRWSWYDRSLEEKCAAFWLYLMGKQYSLLPGVIADVSDSFGMENPMGLFTLGAKKLNKIWKSNYERLSQFCQTHRVPNLRRHLLTEDPKLYEWIEAQRQIYIKYTRLDIEISSVRTKRIERLKLLGFDITKHWHRLLEDERPTRRDDVGWDEYFDKLKQYWIENGKTYKHLWNKERTLSKWKDDQMEEYKKHGLRGNRGEFGDNRNLVPRRARGCPRKRWSPSPWSKRLRHWTKAFNETLPESPATRSSSSADRR
jgi:hypothetical protein